jgi:hypothetical protein
MAIQPIDLQTLFTQVDKVGKTQSDLKEGLQIQQALQGIRMQKKTEERAQSVNESQNTGEGAERIKDRGPHRQAGEEGARRDRAEHRAADDDGEAAPGDAPVFRDPALGKNIDMSG